MLLTARNQNVLSIFLLCFGWLFYSISLYISKTLHLLVPVFPSVSLVTSDNAMAPPTTKPPAPTVQDDNDQHVHMNSPPQARPAFGPHAHQPQPLTRTASKEQLLPYPKSTSAYSISGPSCVINSSFAKKREANCDCSRRGSTDCLNSDSL